MTEFEPIDVDFLINEAEVKKDSDRVKRHIRGVADEAETTTARVNKQVSGIFNGSSVEIDKATTAIGRQKRQYDGLGFSIAQITRELPAFTLSAQTGFLAISNNIPLLRDEIARLKANNDALVASGQKGVPVWRQVAKSFLSWNTLLSIGVTLLTIYGPQIVKFIGNLFNSKKAIDDNAKSLEVLNRAYESNSYQKAVRGVTQVRSAFAGAGTDIDKKREALATYNKVLGEALGTANNYNEAERLFREKSDAYVKALLFRAAATEAVNEASKELIRLTKEEDTLNEEIEEKGGTRSATAQFATKTLREDRREIQKEAREVESTYNRIINRLNDKARQLQAAFNLNLDGDDNNSQTINKRKSLLQKIADLDAEFARKRLDDDAAELKALQDKFAKIRRLVVEFNQDPKNAQVKIDLTELDQLEERAIENLNFSQETEDLKNELTKQKQFFAEFEEFKKQFGIAKAKERYAGELKEFETYAAFIKKAYEDNAPAFSAFIDGTATGPEIDRVNLIVAAAETEKRKQEQIYNELLASLQDYEQQRSRIISDYEAERELLLSRGQERAAEQLKRNLDDSLNDLDEAYAKSTDEYRKLISGIDGLSNEAARAVVANAQRMVEALVRAGRLSEEAAADINREINAVNDNISSREADDIDRFASSLANIGFIMESAADDITAAIGTMVVEVANSIASLSDSSATGLQKASGLVGLIIQAGNLMKQIGENDLNQAVNDQREINQGLVTQLTIEQTINRIRRERAEIDRDSSAFLDSFYQEDFAAALQNRVQSEQALNDALDKLAKNGIFTTEGVGRRLLFGKKRENRSFSIQDILGDLEIPNFFTTDPFTDGTLTSGRFFDPLSIFGGFSELNVSKDALKKLRTAFDDTLTAMGKTSADMANFSTSEWLDFFTVLDEAGFITDEATKKMLANAKEALEEYQKALEEMKAIIRDFAGGLSNDLSNALVSAFVDGTNAADNFKESLNDIINQLFLNNLIDSQFRQYFDALQREMEDSFGIGGDNDWIDDIQRFATNINPVMDNALEALRAFDAAQESLGFEGFDQDGDNDQRGLAGAIRRELTEETASELTGLFRGQFDITKKHLQLDQQRMDLEQSYYQQSLLALAYNAQIEENTRVSAETLGLVVAELRSMNSKTGKTQTARDLGVG